MTTYSLFELEPIFIDFKNESYNLGLDIQANQNDTLTLNFICRNNGIEEDMSKYKVELRVHNNNTNTDYIQTQNENVTLSADGSVKIVCQSLKGNKLTAYSGQLNGVLRIFNTENKQKATRIITMRIIADPLETDKANICESTITKLEDLDWILNEAYNIEDEFKKAIEEAIKQKDALIKTTNEAKVINTTLAGNITTGTELNSNLVNSNKLAETNQKELDTRNITASQNIETLTNKNTISNETIVNISEKIETGSKLDNDLGLKIPIGTTLKNDLDTNIKTGTQLKTDLTELIPKVEKSKSDLDASKTNADLSNKTLIETTNNAEIKKQEVISECKVADEKIKKMNEFGDVSEISKDINLMKTEVTTARNNETDLNTRLERDKTNILKTIGQVNVETDGNVASQLKDCVKKTDLETIAIYNAVCTYADNVYTLDISNLKEADIFTIRFKTPNAYVDNSKIKIGEKSYTIVNGSFEVDELVLVNIDNINNKAFFRSGGSGGGAIETLPQQVDTFTAIIGDAKVALSWSNSNKEYLEGYYIVYKTSGYPSKVTDGAKIDVSKELNDITVDNLTNDTEYFFRIFPYNSKKQVQSQYKVCNSTPKNRNALGNLPVGAKVIDSNSKYKDNILKFIVVAKNHPNFPHNSVTLLSENTIEDDFCLNDNRDTKVLYKDCYVRNTLLNNIFLNGLSNQLKNNLLETTLEANGSSYDSSSSPIVDIIDKIFLLSCCEVDSKYLLNELKLGVQIPYLSEPQNRICKNFNGAVKYWLTRSLKGRSDDNWYYFEEHGGNMHPYGVSSGIRPCFNVNNGMKISDEPNAQGYYEIL